MPDTPPPVFSSTGRYAILGTLGRGGMAQVYLGRMTTGGRFSRLVAIKQLHGHLAGEASELGALLDEARLSAYVRHVNVVSTLDVARSPRGVGLIMDYVEGDSLDALLRSCKKRNERVALPVAIAIANDMLRGLAACHDAKNDRGEPLHIIHRDVSPHNVLVGVDGVARISDLGVARASGRLVVTRGEAVKGKLRYMPPEQLQGGALSRQVDVYAVGAVLWELLAGRRLVNATDEMAALAAALTGDFRPPSTLREEVPADLDRVVMRALSRDLAERYLTAAEMAADLRGLGAASLDDVAAFVRDVGRERLQAREELVRSAPESDAFRSLDEVLAELDDDPPVEGPTLVADTVRAESIDAAVTPSEATDTLSPTLPTPVAASATPPHQASDRRRYPVPLGVGITVTAALAIVVVWWSLRGAPPPSEPETLAAADPSPSLSASPSPSNVEPSAIVDGAAPAIGASSTRRSIARPNRAASPRHPPPRASSDGKASAPASEDPRDRL